MKSIIHFMRSITHFILKFFLVREKTRRLSFNFLSQRHTPLWTSLFLIANVLAVLVGVEVLSSEVTVSESVTVTPSSSESEPLFSQVLTLIAKNALPFFLVLLLVIAAGSACRVIALHLLRVEILTRYLWRVVFAYFELILLFASIYFWLMFFVPQETPLSNVACPWTECSDLSVARTLDLANLRDSIVDVFHFSIVTVSTLGYGDMLPKTWYAKLLVDAQVVCGIGLIILAIGRYFAKIDSDRPPDQTMTIKQLLERRRKISRDIFDIDRGDDSKG